MGVGRGQQFAATSRDPAFPGTGLTLRAMPIAAAVVRDGGTMSAASALIVNLHDALHYKPLNVVFTTRGEDIDDQRLG